MDIIKLAKECGAIYEDEPNLLTETITFFGDQLVAFANSIIEKCAKVAEEYDAGYGSEHHIRSLKVKE